MGKKLYRVRVKDTEQGWMQVLADSERDAENCWRILFEDEATTELETWEVKQDGETNE